MNRLTPFAETRSGEELIKNERVTLLTVQVQDKFALIDTLAAAARTDLEKLTADSLYLLIRQILHLDTLEALEQWIADQLPVQQS